MCVMLVLQGVVIKFNTNQRYATTAITASIVRLIASKVNVPLQVTHWSGVTCTNTNASDTLAQCYLY